MQAEYSGTERSGQEVQTQKAPGYLRSQLIGDVQQNYTLHDRHLLRSALFSIVVTSSMWLLSLWNMASATEKFFHLISL